MLGIILGMRLLQREKYEGLFTKLNSGATNSVGGTSERSVKSLAYIKGVLDVVWKVTPIR